MAWASVRGSVTIMRRGSLKERGDVVGEVTGCETTSDGNGSGMCGEFEDSALAVGTSGDDTDVSWIVDSGDNAGCEDNFLPVVRNGVSGRISQREWSLSVGVARWVL